MIELKSKILLEKPEIKLDLALSVSKAKTFADCKAKFRFSYIEKLPKKEWEHHTFGTFIHAVLELFHEDIKQNGMDEPLSIKMTNAFKQAVDQFKDKLKPEQKKEVHQLLQVYLKQMTQQKQKGTLATVTDNEKPFYINIDDKILLSGFIDRVQIDSDGVLHVADYKSTKNKKYLKDFFQLLTYAFVLYLENPGSFNKIRASYILLRHNFEFLTKEYTIDDILTVEQKFVDYANAINNEKLYRPNPTFLCSYCDYLDNCSDGRDFLDKINGGGAGKNNKFGAREW